MQDLLTKQRLITTKDLWLSRIEEIKQVLMQAIDEVDSEKAELEQEKAIKKQETKERKENKSKIEHELEQYKKMLAQKEIEIEEIKKNQAIQAQDAEYRLAQEAERIRQVQVQASKKYSPKRCREDGIEKVYFGHYPQGADGLDNTPIKWQVLEEINDQILIMSDKILDCGCYHDKKQHENIQWKDSFIRDWLNRIFYNKAFSGLSQAELEAIVTSNITMNGVFWYSNEIGGKWNADNYRANSYRYDAMGCEDTQDKVFLLNVEEARKYFGTDGDDRLCFYNHKRAVEGTEYARGKNAYNAKKHNVQLWQYEGHESWIDAKYHKENKDMVGNSVWWLRNRGADSAAGSAGCAAYVNRNGIVYSDGNSVVNINGARPALWLNLKSEI